nr:MepB family protein [Tissierella sp.]
MGEFYKALEYINDIFYKPSRLTINSIEEEAQNKIYGGGKFKLESLSIAKTIRFRIAKITPNKTGQFVAFWEKDANNNNQAYDYEDAPDLLVINTFKENNFGQFIFPKEVLLKHNILKTESSKGKMGIRVYPIWDRPTSHQAMKTQQWQLEYFINMKDIKDEDIKGIIVKAYLFNID